MFRYGQGGDLMWDLYKKLTLQHETMVLYWNCNAAVGGEL